MSFINEHYKFFSIFGDILLIICLILFGYFFVAPSFLLIIIVPIILGVCLIMQAISMGTIFIAMGTIFEILYKLASILDSGSDYNKQINFNSIKNSKFNLNFIYCGIVLILIGLLLLILYLS